MNIELINKALELFLKTELDESKNPSIEDYYQACEYECELYKLFDQMTENEKQYYYNQLVELGYVEEKEPRYPC